MITRAEIVIEVAKGDFTFRFCMPVGSQYGAAQEAATECAAQIQVMAEDALKRQQDAQPPQEVKEQDGSKE